MTKRKKTAAAPLTEPPAGLAGEALARWRVVVGPLEQRGPVDVDTLVAYCQVWARWRSAEAALARTGQLVKNERGRPVVSPLVSASSQAASQVRQLEKALGLERLAAADEGATAGRRGRQRDEAPALLTRRELADRLGIHPATVTKWERAGMPTAKRSPRGRSSLFNESEVRSWRDATDAAARLAGGATDLQADRARRERAQAALAEQALEIRARELLPAAEVELLWSREVAAVRAKLLALPLTLADRVHRAATEGVVAVEQVLADAVRDALREFAESDRPVPCPHCGHAVNVPKGE